MSYTGQCLCGSVTLTVAAEPKGTRMCWCGVCQKLAAGNATVNLIFPAEAVTTIGDITWYESVADSGNAMRRGFCPSCGTPMFSQSEGRSHLMIVRAGVFDGEVPGPQSIIRTDAAPAWATLDPDLPHVPAQPS